MVSLDTCWCVVLFAGIPLYVFLQEVFEEWSRLSRASEEGINAELGL